MPNPLNVGLLSRIKVSDEKVTLTLEFRTPVTLNDECWKAWRQAQDAIFGMYGSSPRNP